MTTPEQQALFNTFWAALYADIERESTFPATRPLLAHYTSMETLERMLATGQFWLAHPLYMNDVEELRFGVNQGMEAFLKSQTIRTACGSDERYAALRIEFARQFDHYAAEQAIDNYVMCFSEHDPHDRDGRLSMWRGYGNNGGGGAIVFNTAVLTPVDGSPLILSKVAYATSEERLRWLDAKMDEWAALLADTNPRIEDFYLPVHVLLDRIKLFALFTKHCGFKEEQEWRLVYLRERDRQNRLASMLHYSVGKRGVEPRLKFTVGDVEGVVRDVAFNDLVDRIILGPTVSSQMAIAAVRRMLHVIGRESLCEKVIASSTPFRG